MIPSTAEILTQNIEIEEPSSLTWKWDRDRNVIEGMVDKLEAVKQAVYKVLNVPRFKYIIYSKNYGHELDRLFGKSRGYVIPEIKREIIEALRWDTRIVDFEDFEFENIDKISIHVSFRCVTIYGDTPIEMVVNA